MKLPIPNICPATSVSYDFRIAFGNLNNYLERIEQNEAPRTRFLARRAFLHRPIPHYNEYFNPEKYDGVITDQNRDVVVRIDAVVDQLNRLREQEVTDYDALAPLRNALNALISGTAVATTTLP
jgi:hypothetical protein